MREVIFKFDPGIRLATRSLVITRMSRAEDQYDSVAPYYTSNESQFNPLMISLSVLLPENTLWQARLQDTTLGGLVGQLDILQFNTNSNQYPGPTSYLGKFSVDVLDIFEEESSGSSSSWSSQSSSSISMSVSSGSSSSSSKSASSLSSVSSASSASSQSASSKSSQSGTSSSSSKSSQSGSSSSSSKSSQSSQSSSSSSSQSSSGSSSSSVIHSKVWNDMRFTDPTGTIDYYVYKNTLTSNYGLQPIASLFVGYVQEINQAVYDAMQAYVTAYPAQFPADWPVQVICETPDTVCHDGSGYFTPAGFTKRIELMSKVRDMLPNRQISIYGDHISLSWLDGLPTDFHLARANELAVGAAGLVAVSDFWLMEFYVDNTYDLATTLTWIDHQVSRFKALYPNIRIVVYLSPFWLSTWYIPNVDMYTNAQWQGIIPDKMISGAYFKAVLDRLASYGITDILIWSYCKYLRFDATWPWFQALLNF